MSLDDAVQISRLFIPLIALSGIFIAWQQFQANREKVRIDLYQRRLEVYKALLEAIQITSFFDEDRDDSEVFRKLSQSMDEAYFLLPERIYKRIEPIEERAHRISSMHWRAGYMQENLAKPLGERYSYEEGELEAEYEKLSAEFKAEIDWFREKAHPLLRSVFKDVLGFYKF